MLSTVIKPELTKKNPNPPRPCGSAVSSRQLRHRNLCAFTHPPALTGPCSSGRERAMEIGKHLAACSAICNTIARTVASTRLASVAAAAGPCGSVRYCCPYRTFTSIYTSILHRSAGATFHCQTQSMHHTRGETPASHEPCRRSIRIVVREGIENVHQ